MMSMKSDNENGKISCCASCGTSAAGNDGIKLEECSACHLVSYCSIKCKEEHRPMHKKDCDKRMAELRDELLFKQPESSHLGDCPICFLPLPLQGDKLTLMECCSSAICNGCMYTNLVNDVKGRKSFKCLFCRTPTPSSDEGTKKQRTKRINVNDPVAIRKEGVTCLARGDHNAALPFFTKGAELGDGEAHHQMAYFYHYGVGGVERDLSKAMFHLEEASIAGHPEARCILGILEWEHNDNKDRAVKHWMIGSKLGDESSVTKLKMAYREGFISKDDFAAALRENYSALAAMKSTHRENAAQIDSHFS